MYPGRLTRNQQPAAVRRAVARWISASLDRTLGKWYSCYTDGDGNQRLLWFPLRISISAFPRQPAKARPLTRWLRLLLPQAGTSGSGNRLLVAVSPAYGNLEHCRSNLWCEQYSELSSAKLCRLCHSSSQMYLHSVVLRLADLQISSCHRALFPETQMVV